MNRIEDLETQIKELAAREILTETNSGTYGNDEAVRTCGNADPMFAEYRIYTRVGDGRKRHEGCAVEKAPGRARYFSKELAEAQTKLREIRQSDTK